MVLLSSPQKTTQSIEAVSVSLPNVNEQKKTINKYTVVRKHFYITPTTLGQFVYRNWSLNSQLLAVVFCEIYSKQRIS